MDASRATRLFEYGTYKIDTTGRSLCIQQSGMASAAKPVGEMLPPISSSCKGEVDLSTTVTPGVRLHALKAPLCSASRSYWTCEL
jgi:hypothetical protein